MSSGALPPLAGASSGSLREERDEQRTQKVKPLPLMMSSRAPMVQAAAAAAAAAQQQQQQAAAAAVHRARSSPAQQHQQQPQASQPGATLDTCPTSPISPNAQQGGANPFRAGSSKFTRIRGFQGPGGSGQGLALEGNGLQPRPGSSGGVRLAQDSHHASAGSGGGAGPAAAASAVGVSASWDAGSAGPQPHAAWGASSQPGGGIGGSRGGSAGNSRPTYGWLGVGADGAAPLSLVVSGGGSSGGGGGGSGAFGMAQGSSSGAWATRRSGSNSHSASQRAGREVPALDGLGLMVGLGGGGAAAAGGAGGGGSSGGSGGGGAGGLAARPALSAGFSKYFMPLSSPTAGSSGGGGAAAAAHDRPEIAPPLGHLGAGVDAAAAAAPGGDSSLDALHLPQPPQLSSPGLLSRSGQQPLQPPAPAPAQLLHAQSGQQSPSGASAQQLLQRLYRTNRTPPAYTPSLTDPLPEPLSPLRSVPGAAAPTSSLPGGVGAGAGSSPNPSPSPGALSPLTTSLPGGPSTAGGWAGPGPSSLATSAAPSPSVSRNAFATRSAPGAASGASGARSAGGGISAGGGSATAASFASSLARPRTRAAAVGSLADLSAALQKSIAAGMGEWDLRANGTWGHPDIQQRLLRGPLAPEALKNRYRLEERDIISLYRLLYSYSVGFFTDVEALLDVAVGDRASGASVGLMPGSTMRQELLENVFRAYAALWDEALMVVFDSEMSSALADKKAALQALESGAMELETLRKEKTQLQSRLEEFVKQNIDNMLATRHMQQAATRLEGEVYSLNSANEQLVTNLARHAVQVTTLERQLDAARQATEAAEGRAAAAESHLADLRAIISEQNATLSAQFFQIKELERTAGELQETVRNLNRRRAAVLGLLSGNTPESSEHGRGPSPPPPLGAGGSHETLASRFGSTHDGAIGGGGAVGGSVAADEGVLADMSLLDPDELGRLLADKTRAFNLMHADFVVKMHELDEQRSVNAGLQKEIEDMAAEVRRAHEAEAASSLKAERFRSKWEAGRMVVEDLEAQNRRLMGKNAELVRSYWPLMTRLNEAEAEAARCREEAAADRRQAEADRAEAEALRQQAAGMQAAMKELEDLRAEVASHELELPSELMSQLPEGHAATLRRFTRSCHRRVAHLNAQVVALVDQVTNARLQVIQLQNANQRLAQGQAMAAVTTHGSLGSPLRSPLESLGASSASLALASPAAGMSPTSIGGGYAAAAAAAADAAAAATPSEVAELRAALASRDRWLNVLMKGMSSLIGQMENLMARDWETCKAVRLEQQKRKRRAARAAARAARRAAGLEVSESEPASPERSPPVVRRSRLGTASPAAEGSGVAGSEGTSPVVAADGPVATPLDGEASSASAAVAAAGDSPEAVLTVEASGVTGEPSALSSASAERRRLQAGSPAGYPGAEEEEEEEDGEEVDPAFLVASGRLAQLVGVIGAPQQSRQPGGSVSTTASGGFGGGAVSGGPSISGGGGGGGEAGAVGSWAELTPELVALDRGFEKLADSAERLIEWAEGLLKRKEQTSTFGQVRARLESVTKELDAATQELTTLRPTAEALRHSVKNYETRVRDMTSALAITKQRADTAEARLASLEAQLTVVSHQLEEAKTAQKLLEDEYWKAKDVALEAEVTTGELKAGRMRALEAAAKALSSITGLEKEARSNYDQRVALEADLVGYKAWVRHMEATERKYRAALKELSDATSGCEDRDRKLAELKDRITSLEQQLRFKAIEATSLESRVKVLSSELVEERKAARAALAAARTSAASQLDAVIRQAGAAEAEAAAQTERVTVLEARLAEATRSVEAAQAAAEAAEARLAPLTAERDRLRAHVAASQPLLAAMDRATTAIGARLTLLEEAAAQLRPKEKDLDRSSTQEGGMEAKGESGNDDRNNDAAGSGSRSQSGSGASAAAGAGPAALRGYQGGSLDDAVGGLLFAVDSALDAFAALAAESAGDGVPAVLAALEGLVAQLLASLSKGGQEPIQSLVVLKAQLARDDKELVELRSTLAAVQAAHDEAVRLAAEQRAAAAAAANAAAVATAAAMRDSRRAAEAEAALRMVKGQLDATRQQLNEARQATDSARRQLDMYQRRAAELDSDLAAVRNQRRQHEALAAAAQQQSVDFKRRADEAEAAAARDQVVAHEAQGRAAAAEAAAATAAVRINELEAAVAAERRDVERLQKDADAAVAAAEEARKRAVELEQQALEQQAKYADMIRHDEAVEERLRHALFDAENMRKRAAEATAEAATIAAQYEELQQRAWQMQVALLAKQGEKEEVLRELVEVTHAAAARKQLLAAVGSVSVKQRAVDLPGVLAGTSFKASRTAKE